MVVYGLIINFGTEIDIFAPAELSLTPYDHDCYTLELSNNSSKSYYDNDVSESDWRPYNCEIIQPGWFNTKTKYFEINSTNLNDYPNLEYSIRIKTYKEGQLINTKITDYFDKYKIYHEIY